MILGLVGVGQYPSFLRTLGISEQTNMVVFAMTVVGPSTILLRPPEAAVCPGKIELCTSYLLFQSHYTLTPRGTLSLRKPVPAILAFISHFRLKQLDLRNDQVHVDRLAAVL